MEKQTEKTKKYSIKIIKVRDKKTGNISGVGEGNI